MAASPPHVGRGQSRSGAEPRGRERDHRRPFSRQRAPNRDSAVLSRQEP